jgi:hypothetical protein
MWVSRVATTRAGRLVTCRVELYAVAVVELAEGETPRLVDTRTGDDWAGAFTAEEQAEANALLERARVMRRLDEQRGERMAA